MMLRPTGLQLLEPWYQFTLHVPSTAVGRAMSDIQRMSGEFAPPETQGDWVSLTGTAPVSELQDYGPAVTAYTHGQGQLDCVVAGYRPAHDADAVIAAAGYVPTADLPNTPDSVFLRTRGGVSGRVGCRAASGALSLSVATVSAILNTLRGQ